MKNKIFIFIIIGISIFCNSCDDFLDKDPISSFNTGNFYDSENGVLLAVNGAYTQFQSIYNSYLPQIVEARSDNHGTGLTVYDYTLISQCKDDPSTEILWTAWKGYYKAVTACNYVLDKIDGVEFTNESLKGYSKGEVRFLRALAYYDLFRLWGGVPIIDRVVTDEEAGKIPRATNDEMYAFIISELVQASNELPATWSNKNDLGRATKYAAKGIQARVYMAKKEWLSASTLLKEILNSGIYNRFTNWADIWNDKNDNGKEFVFEIQYLSGNKGEGNNYPDLVIPKDAGLTAVPYGGNNGQMYASTDIYNAYGANDIRRDLTVKKGYITKGGSLNTGTIWVNKFCHGSVTAQGDWEINWPVLRISDVYLMYAEALNEIGYTANGEALEILNWNRNRAGLSSLTSVDLPNQDLFRLAIEKERRLEFAFENIRWFDLVRMNRALNVINAFLTADTYPNVNNYKLENYQLIFAIPQEELYRNPNTEFMWQNAGY